MVHESVAKVKNELVRALTDYATTRNEDYLVGQFMDRAGAEHSQRGVYGMSAWSILIGEFAEFISNEDIKEKALRLRTNCVKTLQQWVQDGDKDSVNRDSEAYELKYVIPKICVAYQALRGLNSVPQEASVLKDRLLKARGIHSGWGFTTDAQEIHPISTCIVVRTLLEDQARICNIKDILEDLEARAKDIPDAYFLLYITTTILLCCQKYDLVSNNITLASQRAILRERLQFLLHSSAEAPLHPTCPINVDFYDSYRTRYYRLQPDLISLESLYLMSGPDLVYLKAYPGKPLLDKLLAVLEAHPLAEDTYKSRMSFSTCLEIHHCLARLYNAQELKISSFRANLYCFWSFAGISANMAIMLIASLLLLVCGGSYFVHGISHTILNFLSTMLGTVVATECFDVLRRALTFKNKARFS